ncbi:MAG TPA: TIGR02530 family flagellar biosynthesis protein [Syntrophomonadaceae bacterium]|nr:TIGR02530 family flagellar biosynthesis protein [Syntrophomonadaceae bacterium]
MNNINLYYPVTPTPAVNRKESDIRKSQPGLDFKQVLRQQLPKTEVKFSSHSLKRVEQNNIQVSPEQLEKLNTAVDKAESKGARESCIVMDNMAFIVSIKNRTVITVVDEPRMKDSVFTNIDSAVII